MLNEHEQEAKERWGDTDAYQQSTSRTSKYSKADFAAAKVDQEAATELFVTAFGNSYSVSSPQAQAAVVAHRAAISKWFYECSVEMQKNLAVMYIEDHRFKAYYDGRVRGLSQYVHDAIMAQR
jgi:TipAS antibiotic-recognition domain